MKKLLYPLTILWSLMIVLSGCDLYLDEEDILQGNITNGDGFSAPKTISDSISTITYQFNEGTVYIDEQYRPHIFSVLQDTAEHTVEIRFAKTIPGNLLPARGDYLATGLCDIFEFGLNHQVDIVEQADGCYILKAHMVSMEEVFKELKIQCDFYLAEDTTNNESRSGDHDLVIVPTSRVHNSRFETKPIPIFYLPLNLAGQTKNPRFKELVTERLLKISKGPLSDDSKVQIHGEFDGYLGAEYVIQLRIKVDVDIKKGYYDVRGILSHQFYAGILLSRAKATLSIPLLGNSESEHTDPHSGEKVEFGPNDFIIKSAKNKSKPITTGIGTFRVYWTPELTLDLYAQYAEEEPIGFYNFFDRELCVLGFHKDPNEFYLYPHEDSSSRGFLDYLELGGFEPDFDDLNLSNTDCYTIGNNVSKTLTIGAALNPSIEVGLLYNEVFNIYLQAGLCFDVSYNHDFTDKYKAKVNIINYATNEEEQLSYANKSSFESSLALNFAVGGRIDAYIKQVEIINAKFPEPLIITRASSLVSPELETSVFLNENLTTEQQCWFYAKVKTRRKSFISDPLSVPRLAIFRTTKSNWTEVDENEWEFVKTVAPLNDDKKYNKNTIYEYDFGVPVTAGSILNDRKKYTYIAIPYYKGVYGNYYSSGTSFKVNGVWGIINNAEQVRVKNATFGNSQTYGFKFYATANNTILIDGWTLRVTVSDAVSGRTLSTKDFDLGKMDSSATQKFLMFFNGKTNSYYKVDLALYYKSVGVEEELGTSMTSESIDIQPAGGTTEIDYSEINSSTGVSGYGDYQILE